MPPPKVRALCRAKVSEGRRPLLPVGVLARTWRGGPEQAGLSRLVNACEVVIAAIETGAAVVASDSGDVRGLAEAAEHDAPLIAV